MKTKTYNDNWPGDPALLRINKNPADSPDIEISPKQSDNVCTFIPRTPQQLKRIIATLQAALDEWMTEKT